MKVYKALSVICWPRGITRALKTGGLHLFWGGGGGGDKFVFENPFIKNMVIGYMATASMYPICFSDWV